MAELCAIDPTDCGCTDCITGYSKPLRSATARDIARMITGNLDDRTSGAFTVRFDMDPAKGRTEQDGFHGSVLHALPVQVTVAYQYDPHTEWDITEYVSVASALLLHPEHNGNTADFKENEE
jgi:hypothetical protein